jgi:hypothetical protein
LEDAGDGFVRLKNVWSPLDYIHVEKLQNQAWYGPIEPSWWSAMWILEPVIIPTSVADLSLEKGANLYPNPSTGDFNLSMNNFASNEKVLVTIFNISGQAIYSTSCNVDENGFRNAKVLTGSLLSPGNYYIVAKGKSSNAKAKLLICR